MGIIIKPIVTEKQTAITEKMDNRYGFRVSPDANKLEIKKAIEDMYNVTVVDVNTINYSGKKKSRYTKSGIINGKQSAFKKAIVTLKEPPEFRHIFRRIARCVEQELFRRAWGQYHGEQVQRGAFPAARRADQRDFFTGPDGQGFNAEPIRVVPRFPFECDVSQFAEIHRGKFHLCIY